MVLDMVLRCAMFILREGCCHFSLRGLAGLWLGGTVGRYIQSYMRRKGLLLFLSSIIM